MNIRATSARDLRWTLLVCVTIVAGCATRQMTQATVALDFPLEDQCVESTLRSDPQTSKFREIQEPAGTAYSFEITDPALAGSGSPSFVAREKLGDGGAAFEMTANFSAKRHATEVRDSVMQRQQQIMSEVLERCTGHAARFGPARVCGAGEGDTLCADGDQL